MALLQALLVVPLLATACAAAGDGSNQGVLQLPTDAESGVAALAYTVFPGNGTLLAGQDLMQAERLYSADGSVFLVPQTDGNLVLYNAYAVAQLGHTAVQAALWQSGTYGNSGPQPFILAMQQDCNLVLYNGNAANGGPRNAGDAVFNTATYNQGIPPCSLVVSGAGGGGFVVLDSTGQALFSTLRVLNYPYVTDIATGNAAPVKAPAGEPYTTGFAQTRLHTGSVLVAGGSGFPNGVNMPLPNATLFSPATLTFTPTASMAAPRAFHTLVTAFNGSGLAIGGLTYSVGAVSERNKGYATGTIEAYNPFTGEWSQAGMMVYARTGHVSVVLTNGQVLTAGGYADFGPKPAYNFAELFDPVLGVSSRTGFMATPRAEFAMTLLRDGNVLACGGLNTVGPDTYETEYLFSCELYLPSNRSWVPTGNLTMRTVNLTNGQPFSLPWTDFTLSLLPNGQVLASGPPSVYATDPGNCAQRLSLYDPQTGTWSEPAPGAEFVGPQILLPTGQLLIGGAFTSLAQCQSSGGNSSTNVPELYNPLAGSQKFGSLQFSGSSPLLF